MSMLSLQDKNGTMLLNMEEHHLSSPYAPALHTHHMLEISCITRGTGQYRIGTKLYDLQPGDVIILNNTEPHGIILPQGGQLNNLVIHFEPSFIWNSLSNDLDYNFLLIFFERGADFSNRLDRANPASQRIFGLMQEISEELSEQRLCYELIVKIKLQTIFAEIIRNYNYIDLSKAVKPLPERDIIQMNTLLEYIDFHLESDLRLSELASIVHISPAYFSTVFKKYNGVSPVEFIVHKRVRRAIELIRTTPMNLTEIAMACGFNNGTNFYKAFHKVTGRTPASYRRTENELLSKNSLANYQE